MGSKRVSQRMTTDRLTNPCATGGLLHPFVEVALGERGYAMFTALPELHAQLFVVQVNILDTQSHQLNTPQPEP